MDPVPADAPVEIRFLEPVEAPLLTAAIERSYGDSYDAAWVYDPEEISRRLTRGTMRSIVGVDGDGDVVGHLALDRVSAGASAGHAGQAVVDPRYRGHHLFTTLKRRLATWCTDAGMLGMYSEATAAHPYSQAAIIKLGGHETGFLLGYIPSQVDYLEIENVKAARRQSVALLWLTTNPAALRCVHPPAWHREILTKVYEHNGFDRDLVPVDAVPALTGTTRWSVAEHPDHNESMVTIEALGADVVDVLGTVLASEAEQGRDVVHVELSLADPATAALPVDVHDELGVFFGGVVPELRDGDVLRLQWLNAVDADPSDVTVVSEFGQELLDYVFERKRR